MLESACMAWACNHQVLALKDQLGCVAAVSLLAASKALLYVLVMSSCSWAALERIELLLISGLLACLCQLWPIGASRSFVVSACPALA